MAYSLPEGSSQQFSNTLASAKTVTAITNANPAVATCTGHGYTTGDEIMLSSGWEGATDSVYKIESVDSNSFKVLGLDSTDTSFFPTGSGGGSAQKLSAWTAIPQVLTINANGGDARFTDVNPLAKRNGIRIPTGFNATTVTLSLGFDATTPAYKTMVGLSRSLSKVAFKQVLSGGSVQYGWGYLTVSEFPKLNNNQVNTVDAALTFLGRTMSYDA